MSIPDWARAYGGPMLDGRIRATPEDFQVTEILGFDCDGSGEHDFLFLQKRSANTDWVARQLAKFAGVAAKDVGYSGMKDRHAVTRQWFSVPAWKKPDWSTLELSGVQILERSRHTRKLRRGSHQANRFEIILRGSGYAASGSELASRLQSVRTGGVPNYFGEQRFGREGGNLALADDWASGKRLPRHLRSIAISTVRSFQFNEVLQQRVVDGNWNTLRSGDLANLDGTGSVFGVSDVDADLKQRCATMDLHPAAVLVGDGSDFATPDSRREAWQRALGKGRVEQGSRALRMRVLDLESVLEDDSLLLRFTLRRGGYATAVLREIATFSR